VDIKSKPGKTEMSRGVWINNETTSIKMERVMLNARKKSNKQPEAE